MIWVFFRNLAGSLSVSRDAGPAAGSWQSSDVESAAILEYGPAAVAWAGERLAVFHQDGDGSLVWRRWRADDPQWLEAAATAYPIAARPSSSPSVCALGEGDDELVLVYADLRRRPVVRWLDGLEWSAEETLSDRPMAPYSSPSVARLSHQAMAVFYLSREREGEFPRLFWRRWQVAEGWLEEEAVEVAGHLTRAPGALVDPDGLDLYYWRAGVGIEAQGLFVCRWSLERGWAREDSPFDSILDTSPSPVRCASGMTRLFFAGPGRSLQFRQLGADGSWGREESLGAQSTSDPIACVVPAR